MICFHNWEKVGKIQDEDVHVAHSKDHETVYIEFPKKCAVCGQVKKHSYQIDIGYNGKPKQREFIVSTFTKEFFAEARKKMREEAERREKRIDRK